MGEAGGGHFYPDSERDTDAEREAESRRDAAAAELVKTTGVLELARRLLDAKAKLAAVRTVLLEGGQDASTVRRRALAILGTEED